MNQEKVIKKIKKMLAMAADVSSPNEAATAAKMARALMDKYQVSELDIDTVNHSDFGQYTQNKRYKRRPYWQQTLAVYVAQFNDCIARISDGHLEFVGFIMDAEIAGRMFEYLLTSAAALSKNIRGCSERHCYFKGFSDQLCQRLKQLSRTRIESESDSNALVLKKIQAVNNHFGEARYRKVKTPSRTFSDSEKKAYLSGVTHGRSVAIHPEVKKNAPALPFSKAV